jgi:type III pantothenate kinase
VTIVVDIGNARLKWGRVERAVLTNSGFALHVDAPAAALAQFGAAVGAHVDRIVVANVAGEALTAALTEFARARWGVAPQFIATSAAEHGVRCGYRNPSRLGVDRWAALIGARRGASGPVSVVSAGTAVTFDALDAEGTHRGGLIMAGARLAAEALAGRTYGIGPTPATCGLPAGIELLGRSTDEAVGRGVLLAVAAGVDRAIARTVEALGPGPVLVTGGDGPLLAASLEAKTEYRADLVLEGLAFIASQT